MFCHDFLASQMVKVGFLLSKTTPLAFKNGITIQRILGRTLIKITFTACIKVGVEDI